MQDDVDVHRVVLAWRAGHVRPSRAEQAVTPLRQSKALLRGPKGVEQTLHAGRACRPDELLTTQAAEPKARRSHDDARIEELLSTIYAASRSGGRSCCRGTCRGLFHGRRRRGHSLAANRLVPAIPVAAATITRSSLSAASTAIRSAYMRPLRNAQRNIARVNNHRNTVASLIVAGYHTAGQAVMQAKTLPWPEHLETVKAKDAAGLLAEAESAIKAKDQVRACAVVHRCGELGVEPRAIFDLCLKYALSEDGALHAEKYYRTVSEEFATTRPSFRWRQLVALARVTASEYGFPAPGYADACKLLKV